MRNGWATEWKNSPNIWTHLGKKPNFCAIFEMFRNYFNTPEEKNLLLIIWNTHYEFEEEKNLGKHLNNVQLLNWTLERKNPKYCGTSWKRTLSFYHHISFFCPFWYTPALSRPVKYTKECVYSRQNRPKVRVLYTQVGKKYTNACSGGRDYQLSPLAKDLNIRKIYDHNLESNDIQMLSIIMQSIWFYSLFQQ